MKLFRKPDPVEAARQRLAEIVAANRAAPATREYAKRRAAAKKGAKQ